MVFQFFGSRKIEVVPTKINFCVGISLRSRSRKIEVSRSINFSLITHNFRHFSSLKALFLLNPSFVLKITLSPFFINRNIDFALFILNPLFHISFLFLLQIDIFYGHIILIDIGYVTICFCF